MTYSNLDKEFTALLNFGNEVLEAIVFKPSYKYKKRVLYNTFCAVHNYAHSIQKLVRPEKICYQSAESLFRSLIEAIINIYYILYSTNTQKNALSYLLVEDRDNIRFLNKLMSFIKKYPDYNPNLKGLETIEKCRNHSDKIQERVTLFEKRYGKNVEDFNSTHLVDRAIETDRKLKEKNKLREDNCLERYWVLFYQYFSGRVHLTPAGVKDFVVEEELTLKPNLYGKEEDSERILAITYTVYLLLLEILAKEFKVYNKGTFSRYKITAKTLAS